MHLLDLQDPKSIGQAGPSFCIKKKPTTDQGTLSLPGHAVVTLVPSWPPSPGGGVEPAWGLLGHLLVSGFRLKWSVKGRR